MLNRLQLVSLPANLSPQLSPESPVGEIYRYRLYGPDYSLNELKAAQDWFVTREVKQVFGIVDVADSAAVRANMLRKWMRENYAIRRHASAGHRCLSASNANAGGNYLTMGSQS